MEGGYLRFLFCFISLLWLPAFVCAKNVRIQQDNHPYDGCSFPDLLPITMLDNGNEIVNISLIKNKDITVPNQLVLMKADEITGEIIIERTEVPHTSIGYHSPVASHEACFIVKCLIDKQTSTPFYTLNGTLYIGDDKHQLHPQNERVDIEDETISQLYFMERIEDESAAPGVADYIKVPPELLYSPSKKSKSEIRGTSRGRRNTPDPTDYWMDLFIVLDFAYYSRFMERNNHNENKTNADIIEYLAVVLTGMSIRYTTLELRDDINLRISLSDIYVATDEASAWWTETNKYESSSNEMYIHIGNQLDNFTTWLNESEIVPPVYDHAMLFTSYPWYSDDGYGHIKGLAWVGTFCNPEGYSSSVVQDLLGYQSEGVGAHELGHSLNALHDGTDNLCSADAYYIMSAYISQSLNKDSFRNPHSFSSCSSTEILDFVSGIEDTEYLDTCLKKAVGPRIPIAPIYSAGHVETLCPKIYGNDSFVCWIDWDENPLNSVLPLTTPYVCNSMFCADDNDYCHHLIPPTGTCCANGKRCFSGMCVPAPSGQCVLDDECPFTDQPGCAAAIDNDWIKCFDEFWHSFCCTYCLDRMDHAEPPTERPIVYVDGSAVLDNEMITVHLNTNVSVEVGVNGGIPYVDNVTLECEGQDNITNAGSNTTFFITPTFDSDYPLQCVVFAEHITGLYNMTTSFIIKLFAFPPGDAPHLSVNDELISNNDDVTTYLGETLNINCTVAGGLPEVTNVTLNCTEQETITTPGAVLLQSFEVTQQMNDGLCQCWAEHITGEYQHTMAFTLNVIAPSSINAYTMNEKSTSNSEPIQVTTGDLVDIVCQAFGMPTPGLTIKYTDNGKDMGGQVQRVSETDHYTKVLRKNLTVACDDAGSYKCIADNDIGEMAAVTLSLHVLCPPEIDDSVVIPPAEVSPMGMTEISLQVNSDPAINDFGLSKYRSTNNVNGWLTSRRRKRSTEDADLVKEFDPSEFIATVDYDQGINNIAMSTFDPDPCADCFYSITLSNGVGEPLTVNVEVSMSSAGSTRNDGGPDSGHGSAASLYAVTALAALFLLVLIVGIVIYIYVYQKQTALAAKAKQKKASVRKSQKFRQYPMDGRLWMTNQGFY